MKRRSYAATAGASVRQQWQAQQTHCPHCGEPGSFHDVKNCPALALKQAGQNSQNFVNSVQSRGNR
jgi:hypothetical protein